MLLIMLGTLLSNNDGEVWQFG